MKKNYAYTFKNYQPKWRQLCLVFCSLCLFITPFVSNTAHAANTHDKSLSKIEEVANITYREDQFNVRIGDGTSKQLDCDRNPTTLPAYVTLNGEEIKEGVTYSWAGPNDYRSTQQAATIYEPGDYTLVATHIATGATATATQSVMRMPKPQGSAGPDKVLTRENPTVRLEGSVADDSYQFIWYAIDGGKIVSDRYTLNPVVDAPGTYHLVITNRRSKCSMYDVVKVTREEEENPLRAIINPYGAPQLGCDPSEFYTMTARALFNNEAVEEGITYQWNGPNGYTANKKEVRVTEAGEYTLTVTDTNRNLTATSEPFKINRYTIPEGSAGPDKVLTRDNPTVTLEGSVLNNSGSPTWHAGYDGGNIVSGHKTLNPVVDAPGTYSLVLSSGRCTTLYTVKVTREEEENPLRAVIQTWNVPQLSCDPSDFFRMTARAYYDNGQDLGEGIIYQWNGPNGYTSNEKEVLVKDAGEYTLTVTDTDRNLTATSEPFRVSRYTLPEGSAGPEKVLTCKNRTVTLEGSGHGMVSWTASHGGNIVSGHRTLNPVVDAPGIYTMELNLMRGGCVSYFVVKVIREEDMTVSATGGQLDCTSGTVQLTSSSSAENATYRWIGPNGYTSAEQNPVVKVAGTYTLNVTDTDGGCTATTSTVVTPAAIAMETTQHVIDFDSKPRGLISSIDTEAGPVAIIGRKRLPDGTYAPENHAAIFDSQDPTGDDTNLYTVDWGQVLIINEDQTDYPDASQWGGELILDFSAIGPVVMESFRIVGMDDFEDMSWVYLYDKDGKELNKVYLKPLGINSKQLVHLGNTRGVMKMKVVLDGRDGSNDLAGSAAIDNIKFHVESSTNNPCNALVAANITHMKAYPTSFSDNATLEFIVRETDNYSINLYDTQGMLVKQLKQGTARAGELTTVELNGRELKEGMYFAKLVSGKTSHTFKLILRR